MARIRSIIPGTQDIAVHSTEVDCTHQKVIALDGEAFLHLATFGSDHRQMNKKASQQIQLNEEMAGRLIRVLVDAFPNLKH